METGAGDVKRLTGFDAPLFCLRVDDWRLVFRYLGGGAVQVVRVGRRRAVYG